MIRAALLGSLLGLFSGVVPGPFTALIAATALKRGFRVAFWVAVVPLVSEVAVLAVSAAFLTRLPETALRWMGIVGGVLVFALAFRSWQEADHPPDAEPLQGNRSRVLHGAALAILSPAPWVFWLLVGSPLFLGSLKDGWGAGLLFLGSFLFFFVGIYLGIAALAAFGHRRLDITWHRRLMRGASVGLALAGIVLVWQSWVGNFHEMVAGSEAVEQAVEGAVAPRRDADDTSRKGGRPPAADSGGR